MDISNMARLKLMVNMEIIWESHFLRYVIFLNCVYILYFYIVSVLGYVHQNQVACRGQKRLLDSLELVSPLMNELGTKLGPFKRTTEPSLQAKEVFCFALAVQLHKMSFLWLCIKRTYSRQVDDKKKSIALWKALTNSKKNRALAAEKSAPWLFLEATWNIQPRHYQGGFIGATGRDMGRQQPTQPTWPHREAHAITQAFRLMQSLK